MSEERRACEGFETHETRMGHEYAQECLACGKVVRDDLTEHPLFGFASDCQARLPGG